MLLKRHILVVSVVAVAASVAIPTAGARHNAARARSVGTLLQIVNHTRVAHGLRPLRVDSSLAQAAESHSLDMLRGNYFAHGNFEGRMVAFHVRGPAAGENLAWGNGQYAEAGTIVAEWLASPEHRRNLLRPGWRRIGIGIVSGTFLGTDGAAVVTADFAGS